MSGTGGNPDDDVVFMSRARYFIEGGGGFSILIAGMVRELGGTVLHDEHGRRLQGGGAVSEEQGGRGRVEGVYGYLAHDPLL